MVTLIGTSTTVAGAVTSVPTAVKSGAIGRSAKVGATLSEAVVNTDAWVSVVEVVDSF